MKRSITKRYATDEFYVVWKPDLCIHCANCFNGLPEVFDPRRRPWIIPTAATTPQIKDQVAKCPSGALSIQPLEK